MKGFLICPFAKTVEPIDLGEGLPAIYAALSTPTVRVGTFQIINLDVIGGVQNTLYLDDNALVRRPPVDKFFALPGYPQPLAGRGLIVGTDDEGDDTDSTYTLEKVREAVTFPDVEHLGFERISGTAKHPVLGDVTVIGQRSVFGKRGG